MRRIVVAVDEYARFSDDKAFTKNLIAIAQVGRKYGIHIIVCTQRPDAKVLAPQIRANLPCTLALGVSTKSNAQVLGAPGAELLDKPGLAYLIAGQKKQLLQIKLAGSMPTGPVVPRTGPVPAHGPAKKQPIHGLNHDSAQVVPGTGPTGPGLALGKKAQKRPTLVLDRLGPGPGPVGPDLDHQGMNFMTADEVFKNRGRTPQELGLLQTRKWVEGRRVRGYWLKKI